MSPLMTAPCPIDILDPKQTSPTMVALGAMKSSPTAVGLSLYKLITALALVIGYENLRGAQISLVWAQNKYRRTPRLMIFFNINIKIMNPPPYYHIILNFTSFLHSQTELATRSHQFMVGLPEHYQILSELIIIMLLSRLCLFRIATPKLKPGQHDFMNLLRVPKGSQIPITAEEKQKINLQIDKKMQQLQDTGLSREEILLSKSQKGLPLAFDPFFQYLKKNRLAREIYLRKNDRFTMEKIIDIALRQDIGPDPSYSRTRDNGKINQKGRAEVMHDLQQRARGSFNPTSYYANAETNIDKLYDELKPHQPLRHIYKPINRYERVKTHQRRLKKYDIHWRNIELLRQFMTNYGNIRSRLVNRLSITDQKRVRRAIKTARHNCAIPYYGRTLNPNKRNITSLEEQVKQIGLQNVNLETGQIYYSRPESMDSKELQSERTSDTDWRYEQMIKGNTHKLWINTLDEPQDQEILKAQRFARHVKITANQSKKKVSTVINMRKKALRDVTGITEEDYPVQPDSSVQCKTSFERRKQELSKKLEANPLSFSSIILGEKTLL